MYEKYIKRLIDIILSALGLVALSFLYLIIAAAIVIDDPGPVFFKQKRVGVHKTFFQLHKFRSMKISTPHDIPTHMLKDPDQYITKVGKFLRKSSLDELPQIWDIFVGKMSIIGPRPALWNQDDLVRERDKYSANDVRPGLTGWAQINGRDELEISVKAKLDGDYVQRLRRGGLRAFLFDCRCFVGTIFSVAKCDGVVEGGTSELHRHETQE
jgi:lipopolysaccharide/colanic/teichoic acid biosynthesis glycosyltransferase